MSKAKPMTSDATVPVRNALRKAEETNFWPYAIETIRFLALTGWRSGEVLGLEWGQVDLNRRTALLADTKTGKSIRPLSNAVCDILRRIPTKSGLIFKSSRGEGQMAGFRKIWNRIARLESLPEDITPHVLRHSFTSLASDLG